MTSLFQLQHKRMAMLLCRGCRGHALHDRPSREHSWRDGVGTSCYPGFTNSPSSLSENKPPLSASRFTHQLAFRRAGRLLCRPPYPKLFGRNDTPFVSSRCCPARGGSSAKRVSLVSCNQTQQVKVCVRRVLLAILSISLDIKTTYAAVPVHARFGYLFHRKRARWRELWRRSPEGPGQPHLPAGADDR